ncbi:MAG TPA: hypothetical protein PK507_04720 [bacterium]|nr:hypothetical protein [bacterium]
MLSELLDDLEFVKDKHTKASNFINNFVACRYYREHYKVKDKIPFKSDYEFNNYSLKQIEGGLLQSSNIRPDTLIKIYEGYKEWIDNFVFYGKLDSINCINKLTESDIQTLNVFENRLYNEHDITLICERIVDEKLIKDNPLYDPKLYDRLRNNTIDKIYTSHPGSKYSSSSISTTDGDIILTEFDIGRSFNSHLIEKIVTVINRFIDSEEVTLKRSFETILGRFYLYNIITTLDCITENELNYKKELFNSFNELLKSAEKFYLENVSETSKWMNKFINNKSKLLERYTRIMFNVQYPIFSKDINGSIIAFKYFCEKVKNDASNGIDCKEKYGLTANNLTNILISNIK